MRFILTFILLFSFSALADVVECKDYTIEINDFTVKIRHHKKNSYHYGIAKVDGDIVVIYGKDGTPSIFIDKSNGRVSTKTKTLRCEIKKDEILVD